MRTIDRARRNHQSPCVVWQSTLQTGNRPAGRLPPVGNPVAQPGGGEPVDSATEPDRDSFCPSPSSVAAPGGRNVRDDLVTAVMALVQDQPELTMQQTMQAIASNAPDTAAALAMGLANTVLHSDTPRDAAVTTPHAPRVALAVAALRASCAPGRHFEGGQERILAATSLIQATIQAPEGTISAAGALYQSPSLSLPAGGAVSTELGIGAIIEGMECVLAGLRVAQNPEQVKDMQAYLRNIGAAIDAAREGWYSEPFDPDNRRWRPVFEAILSAVHCEYVGFEAFLQRLETYPEALAAGYRHELPSPRMQYGFVFRPA